MRVSVWWDFENCSLPAGINVFKVAQSITNAVRVHGILGPVQITAFGDVLQLSRVNQEALSSTGINLSHVPNGLSRLLNLYLKERESGNFPSLVCGYVCIVYFALYRRYCGFDQTIVIFL